MRRIAVVGSSGSGKTTMAATLAKRLGLAHIELDAIFHQPDWQQLDGDEFSRRVEAATEVEGWTLCGNYSKIDHIRFGRADTVVWLDYAKPVVISRLVRRTVRRAVTREELWNGNREPITNFTSWDPDKNVIRWSWVNFDRRRETYERHADSGSWDHLTVHRFTRPADADTWLEHIR